MWPTKNRRPLRRATFGHAARHDPYLVARRYEMRAAELAQVDWLLYRRNCNPFTRGRPAWRAYNRAFNAERRNNPDPGFPPIPDLPRARRARPRGLTP